jgi:hypothetical protein
MVGYSEVKSCQKCMRTLALNESKCKFCNATSLCNKCGKGTVYGKEWFCEPCLERGRRTNKIGLDNQRDSGI